MSKKKIKPNHEKNKKVKNNNEDEENEIKEEKKEVIENEEDVENENDEENEIKEEKEDNDNEEDVENNGHEVENGDNENDHGDEEGDEEGVDDKKKKDEKSTKVRVSNLSFVLDNNVGEVRKKFEECGTIVDVEFIKKNDGNFSGTIIINFEDTESASKATEFHDEEFFGRKMKISNFKEGEVFGRVGRKTKPQGCKTIFIGNLPYTITEEEVYNFFEQFGKIKEIRWPKGDFNGYGWIEFTNTKDTDKAMTINGQLLKGRPLKVDYAN